MSALALQISQRVRRLVVVAVALTILITVALVVVTVRTDDRTAPAEKPSTYTGDWKDLLIEQDSTTYTGDWKDLLIEESR